MNGFIKLVTSSPQHLKKKMPLNNCLRFEVLTMVLVVPSNAWKPRNDHGKVTNGSTSAVAPPWNPGDWELETSIIFLRFCFLVFFLGGGGGVSCWKFVHGAKFFSGRCEFGVRYSKVTISKSFCQKLTDWRTSDSWYVWQPRWCCEHRHMGCIQEKFELRGAVVHGRGATKRETATCGRNWWNTWEIFLRGASILMNICWEFFPRFMVFFGVTGKTTEAKKKNGAVRCPSADVPLGLDGDDATFSAIWAMVAPGERCIDV